MVRVWATGYGITFPFLDPGLLPDVNGVPAHQAVGTLAPDLAGLYFVGLVTPGCGNFLLHHAQAQLVADVISAQARHSQPLARTAFAGQRPSARMCAAVSALLAEAAATWRAEPADGRLPRTGQDGAALAERLLVGGHDVCGVDISPEARDRFTRAGGGWLVELPVSTD
jgi:hypothetical protein